MSDYSRERWDEIKALTVEPKPALEDRYTEQLMKSSGYSRSQRRANGQRGDGRTRKRSHRPVRPSGTAPARPKGEGLQAAQRRAQARQEAS